MRTFSALEKRTTIIAVMVVFLLSALDQTIVSTAMPRIIAELHGLDLYAWVTTAYLLTSTIAVPIWGKLSDHFGRKPILLAGIGFFLVGSWLCGLAGEFGSLPILGSGMVQLIVFRALQGIGGGALFTTAFAIIGDLFEPRERAKFAGLFGSVFAIASVIGPIVGGFFTDHGTVTLGGHVVAGWRWVFYVNLPLSLVALFMIIMKMPKVGEQRPGRIDVLGAVLIITTFTPFLLALTWGGGAHPWGSPLILGLLAVAGLSLGLFLYVERIVANPIVPLELFSGKVFCTANAAGFTISMAFMGSMVFLPLYMQIGQGVAATASGLAMLPLMGGMIASSTVCGLVVSRLGRYKPMMVAGGALLVIGAGLLCLVGPHTSQLDLAWRLLIMGIGLGPPQSLFNLAIQNDAAPHQMGVATSSTQFIRQIGSTMGVALFGAVLSHAVAVEFDRRLPPAPPGVERKVDLGALHGMAAAGPGPTSPAAAAAALQMREGLTAAILVVFRTSFGLVLFGVLLSLLVPDRPLKGRHKPDPAAAH